MILVLLHDDGHAIALASPVFAPVIWQDFHVLREFDLGPYRLEVMDDHHEAARLRLAAEGCPVCTPVMPCGCTLPAVNRGDCPHGTLHRVSLMRLAFTRVN